MKNANTLEQSAYLNAKTYGAWFNQLYGISLSVFEWLNLPETIDERYLEMVLFWNGQIIFFKDENIGFLALPVMATGPLNVYGIPTMRTAFAYNGYQKPGLTDIDSVLMYNNYTRTPDVSQIQLYAQRLYEIERSIDVNVKSQKTPLLIVCDENQRLSLMNMYQQYDGNAPVIFGAKSAYDKNAFNAISPNVNYTADKLQILKRQYWNEALTYLGVEALTSEKAERLVTGEVTSNLGGTEAQRLTRLNARKQACRYINERFGLNIDVRFRSDLTLSRISENKPLDFSNEEGEQNE